MKRFYILFFIVFLALCGQSQSINASSTEVKILKFYPNPAITQITFSFDRLANRDLSFQIFNFIGKKVFETQSLGANTVVNLAEFYRGVYIFQLRDKNGRVLESGKFQVTK